MSDRQEFYGPTVEEALTKASAALGLARDRLEFEVLDHGSSGFLGIGAREARIQVENRIPRTGYPAAEDLTAEVSDEEGVLSVEEPSDTPQPREDSGPQTEEAPYELIMRVDKFMSTLIDSMGLQATLDAHDAGDAIYVDVSTKETGLFIGQKGETIDAIQYLLNVVTYKNRPFVKRIVVDSEGYRQRRIEAIQGMAHRTARRATREKRSLSLPPMSAAERRVVHLFLKENPHVTTYSNGEDEDRRVIISPM